MAFEQIPVILTWDFSSEIDAEGDFQTMLDSACDRLREKHIEYSIRRIREMDGELEKLEKELDEFLGRL